MDGGGVGRVRVGVCGMDVRCVWVLGVGVRVWVCVGVGVRVGCWVCRY